MNSDQLQHIVNIPSTKFYITRGVYHEIASLDSQKKMVDEFVSDGKLNIWLDELNVSVLMSLYSAYELGDGETESICVSKENAYHLCTDDKKARIAAEKEIPSLFVMGSLRLLKNAVAADIIKCTDARFSYLEMKLKGGFLPKNVHHDYFCSAS